MSESEKYEAQGRALAALKRAKSNAATLSAVVQEHARVFNEAGGLLARFARDPLFKSESLIALSDHLKAQLAGLPDAKTLAGLVDELAAESARVKELEETVDRF